MPVMQYHSEFNHHQLPLRDRTPWHVADTNGDPEVVEVFRRYAALRERLVPYLRVSAAHTVATDAPLMRGLFFDWPRDPQVWQHPAEYLLGDSLLVHPVTEPGAQRWETYLPEGEWVDVWTGEQLAGGREVSKDVTGHVIPVYCKAGDWPDLAEVFAD
jgi:alpha-glucosidase (family GH31 glycosyl hydrolase)